MFVLIVLGASVVVLAGAVFAYGSMLPRGHVETIEVELSASRAAVWNLITGYEDLPSWWSAVKKITRETDASGRNVWWNTDKRGQRIPFVTAEEVPKTKLVRQIVSDNLPFGGTWTFELQGSGEKTRMTLTEDGFINPPIFRVMAKLFFNNRATMEDFVRALQARLATKP